MNESDKAFARRMLQEKRLGIDQVERIKAEVDRGGRSFRDVATGLGLLSEADVAPVPKPPLDPLYMALLGVSAIIFLALLILTITRAQERSAHDDEVAVATSKSMTEAEHKSAEARIGYQRSLIEARESRARDALARARAAMARVDAAPQAQPATPEIHAALDEAFVGYNTCLEVFPDDAGLRLERARVHELRRNYDLAITDLERAAALQPDQAAALRDRVSQLRLLLARTPK